MRKLLAVLALVFSAMALATPAQAAAAEIYTADLRSVHDSRCLDQAEWGTAKKVIVHPCNDGEWQRFQFRQKPGFNYWEIKPIQHLGSNQCLSIEDQGRGWWIERAPCNLTEYQVWTKIEGHGGGSPIKFESYSPGPNGKRRCLDIEASGRGERIQAWECHSASYQNWVHVERE